MTSDRLIPWLCASAIGLCLLVAAAGIYVLTTDPTRDLQPSLADQLSKAMQPAGVTR
jgi:hypothetical protein